MMRTLAFLFVCSVVTGVMAQERPRTEPERTNAPSRGRSQSIVSPEVHSNRTVTFRLRAPEAGGVKVSGEWPGGATELTNNEGIWIGTVGPLEPDIYGYSFTVANGLTIADPANPWLKPMRATRTSTVQIPGEPARIWEFQAVPHGTVHSHDYHSKALDLRRRLHVYTPPGYEKGSEKYPVLYLFHGAGDNDATWTAFGHAHFIADNLFAQKEARPMIIVMTDGHATTANPTRVSTNMISRNVEAFSQDLLQDVLPLIESTYRVKTTRDDRAIIGLSMGGGQSLTIGLKNRNLFAWVGGMSSFLPNPEKVVAETFDDSKSDLRLLWLACGKDDFLIENARQLAAALKAKNVPHQYRETEGNHSWPVWRRYLADYMPLIFQNDSKAPRAATFP